MVDIEGIIITNHLTKILMVSIIQLLQFADLGKGATMTKFLFVIGFPVLLLFWGCTGQSTDGSSSIPVEVSLDDRIAPLILEKIKELPFNLISKEGPSLIRVNDKNHFYVSVLQNAEKNCEILKYSSDEFQVKARSVIRRGQGPAEALNPRILGGDTDTIVIYDVMAKKYLQYNANFNYIGEYRVKDIGMYNYSGGVYLPRHRLVVDAFKKKPGIDRENLHSLFARDFYNSRDTKLFEIRAPWAIGSREKLKFVISKPLHFCFLQEHYYILNKRNYRIIKMNLEGRIVKDLKIKFKPIAVPKSLREKWLIAPGLKARVAKRVDFEKFVYSAVWIVPFGEGFLVGRCTDHDPCNKGPVIADYFDKDLNFKGKLNLPYFSGWNNPSYGGSTAASQLYYIDSKMYLIDERGDNEYWITQWNVKTEKFDFE
jgi:hypothetical protein